MFWLHDLLRQYSQDLNSCLSDSRVHDFPTMLQCLKKELCFWWQKSGSPPSQGCKGDWGCYSLNRRSLMGSSLPNLSRFPQKLQSSLDSWLPPQPRRPFVTCPQVALPKDMAREQSRLDQPSLHLTQHKLMFPPGPHKADISFQSLLSVCSSESTSRELGPLLQPQQAKSPVCSPSTPPPPPHSWET